MRPYAAYQIHHLLCNFHFLLHHILIFNVLKFIHYTTHLRSLLTSVPFVQTFEGCFSYCDYVNNRYIRLDVTAKFTPFFNTDNSEQERIRSEQFFTHLDIITLASLSSLHSNLFLFLSISLVNFFCWVCSLPVCARNWEFLTYLMTSSLFSGILRPTFSSLYL